tara:strand:+ start:525 stop:1115 length:591 start_codon:yes stop_codon:yes gene_type:complete
MNIIPLFAQPLAITINTDHKKIQKQLITQCRNIKNKIKKGGTNWHVSTFNTCSTHHLHTDKFFDPITNWIFKEILLFSENIGFKNKKINCTHSWFNFYKKYDHQEEHDHVGERDDFIAVYFLTGTKQSGDLILKPSISTSLSIPDLDQNNLFTWGNYKISTEPGKLVMFKGDMRHLVTQNKSNKPRISLAYNFKIA